MVEKKQLLLKQACVFAMLVAICFVGPSLSARRHNTRHEKLLPGVSIASNDKVHAPIAKLATISAGTLTGRGHTQVLNVADPAAKFIAGAIADTENFGVNLPFIIFTGKTAIQFFCLTLPGYYAFLFRYALF